MAMAVNIERISGDQFLEAFRPGSAGQVGGSLQALLTAVQGTTVLLSTKEHKVLALEAAMKYMGVNGRLTRLPISNLQEPNYIKSTDTLIREKSDLSVGIFVSEYPGVVRTLRWFREILDVEIAVQDVRPKVGEAGISLKPMTNPTADVKTGEDLSRYIGRHFDHGAGPTTVRIENGFERTVLGAFGGSEVRLAKPFATVVAGMYVTFETNPLFTKRQRELYLEKCAALPNNANLQQNRVVAGGVLNEALIYYAAVYGIGIEATIDEGVSARTANIPVETLLRSVYPKEFIPSIHKILPVLEDGGNKEERIRNFATIALATLDYARGGSYTAVAALFGQQRCANESPRTIDIKAGLTIRV